jgi:U3 small nucleolar ribonucleoprotein component
MDVLDIAQEIEIPSSIKTKKVPKEVKRTKAKKNRKTLNKQERQAAIDKVKLINFVKSKVTTELFEECFPERAQLWEYITTHNHLEKIVNFSTHKYLQLYALCSTKRDKNSVLFLEWLDFMRSVTCKFNREYCKQ